MNILTNCVLPFKTKTTIRNRFLSKLFKVLHLDFTQFLPSRLSCLSKFRILESQMFCEVPGRTCSSHFQHFYLQHYYVNDGHNWSLLLARIRTIPVSWNNSFRYANRKVNLMAKNINNKLGFQENYNSIIYLWH